MTWTTNRILLEMIMLCFGDLSSSASRFSHRQNSKGLRTRAKASNFEEGSKISDLICSLIFCRVEGIFGRFEEFSFEHSYKILSNSSKAPNTTLQTHLKTKFKFLHSFSIFYCSKKSIEEGKVEWRKEESWVERMNVRGKITERQKLNIDWISIEMINRSMLCFESLIIRLAEKLFCSANFSFFFRHFSAWNLFGDLRMLTT